MSSNDDFEDDRPRRRPRDDDDDDRPARSRRLPGDDDDRPPPKKGHGLLIGVLVGVFLLCCGGGGAAVYYIVTSMKKGFEQVAGVIQEAGETAQSQQNLMRIGTAANQHAAANGAFPNNSYGPDGKSLLSWRVHLLPYLGEDALYKQFKLDEPWDSANNIRLLNQMPDVYGGPVARQKAGAGKTFYRGFSAPGGIFEKPPGPGRPAPKIKITDVTDGIANTLLVVDAGDAVEWTKPDDLDFSPGKPRPALGGAYPSFPVIFVLMADGTVHQMRKDVPDDTLRKLIDRKDGQRIPADWENPGAGPR